MTHIDYTDGDLCDAPVMMHIMSLLTGSENPYIPVQPNYRTKKPDVSGNDRTTV